MTITEPDRDPNHANRALVAEFRANAGRIGGYFGDTQLLLLTTTGAKTGVPRTRPLAYLLHNDRYVVVAASAGAPDHPDWSHNLVSDPEVVIEVGDTTSTATAGVLGGAQREALLGRFESEYPVSTSRTLGEARGPGPDSQGRERRPTPAGVAHHGRRK